MAAPDLASRTLRGAAKLRQALFSVAPVASGYERGRAGTPSPRELPQEVPASLARFSRPETTTCSAGGR